MSRETQQKSLRLEVELIEKVKARAKKENRTFNNMVETILKNEINGPTVKIYGQLSGTHLLHEFTKRKGRL